MQKKNFIKQLNPLEELQLLQTIILQGIVQKRFNSKKGLVSHLKNTILKCQTEYNDTRGLRRTYRCNKWFCPVCKTSTFLENLSKLDAIQNDDIYCVLSLSKMIQNNYTDSFKLELLSRVYTKFIRKFKYLGGFIRAYENPYWIKHNNSSFRSKSYYHIHVLIDLYDIHSDILVDELENEMGNYYVKILNSELLSLCNERGVQHHNYKKTSKKFNTHLEQNKSLSCQKVYDSKCIKRYFLKEVEQKIYNKTKTKKMNLAELLYHYRKSNCNKNACIYDCIVRFVALWGNQAHRRIQSNKGFNGLLKEYKHENILTDKNFKDLEQRLCNPLIEASHEIIKTFKDDVYYYWQGVREKLRENNNIYADDIINISRSSKWMYKITISNISSVESRYYQEFLSAA